MIGKYFQEVKKVNNLLIVECKIKDGIILNKIINWLGHDESDNKIRIC